MNIKTEAKKYGLSKEVKSDNFSYQTVGRAITNQEAIENSLKEQQKIYQFDKNPFLYLFPLNTYENLYNIFLF